MEIKVPADYDPERDGTALFHFADDPCFPCHPTGETWNGFDNVKVSPQVRDVIAQTWQRDAEAMNVPDEESEALLAIEPDADGQIDLSNGYATELDYANLQAVLDAGFQFVPHRHGVVQIEWGDERILVNAKGEESRINLATNTHYAVILDGKIYTATTCRELHDIARPLGWLPKGATR